MTSEGLSSVCAELEPGSLKNNEILEINVDIIIGLAGLSNRALTFISRLTEHTDICLSTYPVVVLCHLSLQPLLPYSRSQQCFTTTVIRLFGHFEKLKLPLANSHVAFLATSSSKSTQNFHPSYENTRCLADNEEKMSASTSKLTASVFWNVKRNKPN